MSIMNLPDWGAHSIDTTAHVSYTVFIGREVLITTFLTWQREKGEEKVMRIQKRVAFALIDAG